MELTFYPFYILLGIVLGILTGLTPGLHFNNIAVIIFSLHFSTKDPLGASILIISMVITHTFVDFIPSTFLGAPEEDTSLSILPMHRMLMSGEGYKAVYLSTWGSLLAYLFSLPLIPIFFFFFALLNGEKYLYFYLPIILFALILHLLYLESKKSLRNMIYALIVFFLAGIFGIIALNMPMNHNIVPIKLQGSNTLFPIFTGLFGLPVLFISKDSKIPPQKLSRDCPGVNFYMSSFIGSVCGALVGFLPGVTSGIAAVLSRSLQRGDERNYIVSLGSVNTANYIFNLLSLYLLLKPRSLAIDIVGNLLNWQKWNLFLLPPSEFILLLLTVGLSSLISFFVTLKIARVFALKFGRLGERYAKINLIIFISLLGIIFLLTGIIGLMLASIAMLIGLLPSKLGTMRVHLMGVLILPLMLSFFRGI